MFALDKIVPWGRSFDEYCRMFSLNEIDLTGRILGCADGPAGFNAEATQSRSARRVVRSDLRLEHFRDSRPHCRDVAGHHRTDPPQSARVCLDLYYVTGRDCWTYACKRWSCSSPITTRAQTEGRYVTAELPLLPFEDRAFDLAVCSHFLFLYSQSARRPRFITPRFKELCRVANEVRIFPLLALGAIGSSHVSPIAAFIPRTRLHRLD